MHCLFTVHLLATWKNCRWQALPPKCLLTSLKYVSQLIHCLFIREELKEQLEKKKKGSRALADFEDKMNNVCLYYVYLHLHNYFFLLLFYTNVRPSFMYFNVFQKWRKELAKNREKLLGGGDKEKDKKTTEKEKEEKKEKKEVCCLFYRTFELSHS